MSAYVEFATEAEAQFELLLYPGAQLIRPRGKGGTWKVRRLDETAAAAVAQAKAVADVWAERDQEAREAVKQVARGGGYLKLGALLKQRTHVDWLIRDVLERGVLAVIAGPKGSYKSAWLNDGLMRIVLRGEVVFLISPEGQGLQRRLQGWLDEFAPGTEAESLPLYARNRRTNLSASEEMDVLCEWLEEIEKDAGKPVACIAIDTWSKSTTHDEDSNTQTKLLLNEIDRRLRHRGKTPASVIIVHHTPISDASRARGASALTADTDAFYSVTYKNETVTVTRERFKDSPSLPPLHFKPKVRTLDYTDPDGNPVSSVVLMPTSAPGKQDRGHTDKQREMYERAVLKIESEGGKATAAQIFDTLNGQPVRLRQRLTSLVTRGDLRLDGTLYSIPAPLIQSQEGF